VAIVNPEIVERMGSVSGEEGCLSVPGVQGEVCRAETVVVRGLDERGNPVQLAAEGILSRALQHEIDHLDGILFLDRVLRGLGFLGDIIIVLVATCRAGRGLGLRGGLRLFLLDGAFDFGGHHRRGLLGIRARIGRFEIDDDSKNVWWVALLTFGEGWHNNHHAHPVSARHGLAWYEFDWTWESLKLLRAIGLVWDIKVAKVKPQLEEAAA